jgi:hypothetical protein
MQFLSHSKSKGVNIQAGYLISKLSKALSIFGMQADKQRGNTES